MLKVGRIEAMEILLKILNMKVVEAEEKEVFLMKVMRQVRKINNPSLQVEKLIQKDIQHSILFLWI